MALDFQTLAVAVSLAAAFCASARILLWRMHPDVPGLGHWGWAGILSAIALALYSQMHGLPRWWMLPLPPLLASTALMVAWDGFRRFFGRSPLPRATWLVLAAVVALPPYAASALDWTSGRILTNSANICVLAALIARELWQPSPWSGLATRVTAYAYAATALFMVLRIAATLRGQDVDFNGPFPSLALLWWLANSVAVTLGMALMTGERLQWDLDRQASQDPLTGTLNRRAFTALATREVARSRRTGRPLSLLAMDLDHFKRINDQFGHAVGDEALCRFVAVAIGQLRGNDILCRFGGEEFVALLPETDTEAAWVVGERLRLALTAAGAIATESPLTVSMGIAELEPADTMEDTLKRADAALYQAKANGRNRCVMAEPSATAVAVH